jgi:hypothetical protein
MHPTGSRTLPDGVLVATSPNGSTVFVAVNADSSPTTLSLDGLVVGGGDGCATHVLTDATHDTAVVAQLPVTGGKMSASLPSESISTFVLHVGSTAQCPPPPPPPPPAPAGAPVHIRLRNSTGLCLTGTDKGVAVLSECSSSLDAVQKWSLPTSGSGTVSLVAGKGSPPGQQCLGWRGESNAVALEACLSPEKAAAQQWTWDASNMRLQAAGGAKCDWQYGSDSCCMDDWGGAQRSGDVV